MSSDCLALGPRDPLYPEMLRPLLDAPETLYARGTLPLSSAAVAIVGSRKPTPYGRRMARELAAGCARFGLAVVSGLARGIDTEAHRAALDFEGKTWVVLGSGLDRVYPPENASLAEAIVAAGGACLSEIEPGGAPLAMNFPKRNRIISGLAWAVIVVEGDLRSGSLITAKKALEQGREVFAVPGPADSPLSAGPNELIAQGARMARRVEDLFDELPALRVAAEPAETASRGTQEEQKILKLIGEHSLALEDMVSSTGWDLPRVLRVLSSLEAGGRVIPIPGQRYART